MHNISLTTCWLLHKPLIVQVTGVCEMFYSKEVWKSFSHTNNSENVSVTSLRRYNSEQLPFSARNGYKPLMTDKFSS